MKPVDANVSLEVGHPISRTHSGGLYGYGTTDRTYLEVPGRVCRPENGSAVVEVRCPECDALIRVQILSVRRTQRSRRMWVALAVAGGLVCAALLVILLTLVEPASLSTDQRDGVVVASVVAGVLGLYALFVGQLSARCEVGVRTKDDSESKGHTVVA